MAEAITQTVASPSFRPSFFLWMTLSMSFFIFAGFGLTYLQPMARGSLGPVPPVVHLHGFVHFSWMLLLVAQAFLVNVRNIRLHRSLGTFGIAVATAVLISGFLLTSLFVKASIDNPPADFYRLTYLSVVAVLGFGTLFCLAIRSTSTPERHKRLILFATMGLLPPGINRLYMVSFGLTDVPVLATYLTLDAMIAAIFIYDWRKTGRITPASATGAAVVLASQLAFIPVVESQAFANLTRVLADLAYY
jgi:uncharacterized membrane protein